MAKPGSGSLLSVAGAQLSILGHHIHACIHIHVRYIDKYRCTRTLYLYQLQRLPDDKQNVNNAV